MTCVLNFKQTTVNTHLLGVASSVHSVNQLRLGVAQDLPTN